MYASLTQVKLCWCDIWILSIYVRHIFVLRILMHYTESEAWYFVHFTNLLGDIFSNQVIGFNHGLPWCVKYMARGPPVTTKPDGEAGGFCGDQRPEGHLFHTSRQAMIKTYYSTSIRKTMVQNCSYFTQLKSTTTAIDYSNRRRNKLGLGCSREATAPLI